MEQLDKIFGVTEAGSDVATEIRAGGATFLTMAYILLVNPSMLAATGIPFNDALFATSIAAFIGCMAMGLWAKLPFDVHDASALVTLGEFLLDENG